MSNYVLTDEDDYIAVKTKKLQGDDEVDQKSKKSRKKLL